MSKSCEPDTLYGVGTTEWTILILRSDKSKSNSTEWTSVCIEVNYRSAEQVMIVYREILHQHLQGLSTMKNATPHITHHEFTCP